MRIIDYLNKGQYLKRVTDQQPAIQGHVNYVIEQLSGSGIVDITPKGTNSAETAIIPLKGDNFFIDISKLDPGVSQVDIALDTSWDGAFLGNKQVWIKHSASNNVAIEAFFEFPLGVQPPWSVNQDKVDVITLAAGPFEGIYAAATLSYDIYSS